MAFILNVNRICICLFLFVWVCFVGDVVQLALFLAFGRGTSARSIAGFVSPSLRSRTVRSTRISLPRTAMLRWIGHLKKHIPLKPGVFAVASIGFVLKGWMDYNETSKKIEHDFSPSTFVCVFFDGIILIICYHDQLSLTMWRFCWEVILRTTGDSRKSCVKTREGPLLGVVRFWTHNAFKTCISWMF